MKQVRWIVILSAVVIALAVAAFPSGDKTARTPEQRVTHLASQIRCPTCAGLSVEQSDAPLAQSVKNEIRDRVGQGQSDEQIRAYMVSKYGDTALMSPEKTGINRVPWMLPVLFGLIAVIAVVLVIRRWRSQSIVDLNGPTAADRALVEAALRARS